MKVYLVIRGPNGYEPSLVRSVWPDEDSAWAEIRRLRDEADTRIPWEPPQNVWPELTPEEIESRRRSRLPNFDVIAVEMGVDIVGGWNP